MLTTRYVTAAWGQLLELTTSPNVWTFLRMHISNIFAHAHFSKGMQVAAFCLKCKWFSRDLGTCGIQPYSFLNLRHFSASAIYARSLWLDLAHLKLSSRRILWIATLYILQFTKRFAQNCGCSHYILQNCASVWAKLEPPPESLWLCTRSMVMLFTIWKALPLGVFVLFLKNASSDPVPYQTIASCTRECHGSCCHTHHKYLWVWIDHGTWDVAWLANRLDPLHRQVGNVWSP